MGSGGGSVGGGIGGLGGPGLGTRGVVRVTERGGEPRGGGQTRPGQGHPLRMRGRGRGHAVGLR